MTKIPMHVNRPKDGGFTNKSIRRMAQSAYERQSETFKRITLKKAPWDESVVEGEEKCQETEL